jgi:PAS domain S-box-containing protein
MGQQHAILIIDSSIRVLHASPGAALMFGFDSSEQMVGGDGFALVAPDEDERARNIVAQQLGKQMAGTRGPWRMARKDGSTFIVEVEATYIREPGRDTLILLSMLDTTEQRRTTRALARALEWTDHLLDLTGTIIVELDHSGRVSRVNAEGARILGHPREWILGKLWIDHFVPESKREQVRDVATKIMSGELDEVKFYENPVLTASGEERVVYWHNSFTRDGQGNVSHILSSGLDITERVAAEHRHRTIFERAANPIARLALDGTIIDCNQQVERVFGYPVDQLRGKNARQLIHPDDHARIAVDLGDIRELETYYQRHYRAQHRDGHAIDIEVDASLGRGSGGEQEIIILVSDVSVRRRSERLERLSHRLLRIFHQHRHLDGLAEAFCAEVCNSTGCAAVAVRRRLPDGSAPWVANQGFPEEIAVPQGGLAEGETGGFASMVTVPVRFGERDLGLIHAASIEPLGIPRDVLSVLDESALQLGIAMQRIQAERELHEQLTFQQEVLEAMPIPVYYKDTQGRMIGWNRAWMRATGFRTSEVEGRRTEQLIPSEEADKFIELDAELLARPGRQVFEHSFVGPSGQQRDTVIHRATFSRGGQQVGGIIGAMVDVTALKRATTALEDLNRNLELRVQERLGELQTLYRLSRELVHTSSWATSAGPHCTTCTPPSQPTSPRWRSAPASDVSCSCAPTGPSPSRSGSSSSSAWRPSSLASAWTTHRASTTLMKAPATTHSQPYSGSAHPTRCRCRPRATPATSACCSPPPRPRSASTKTTCAYSRWPRARSPRPPTA